MSLYGRTGTITARTGQRDALLAILVSMSAVGMPGCLAYWLGTSAEKPDDIMITEVWTSAEHHVASLKLPAVGAAIAQARPMIAAIGGAGFDLVGGLGLPQ